MLGLVILFGGGLALALDWWAASPWGKAHREARKLDRMRVLKAQVDELWREKETAIDWLRLQGHTRASAEREYQRLTSARGTARG